MTMIIITVKLFLTKKEKSIVVINDTINYQFFTG